MHILTPLVSAEAAALRKELDERERLEGQLGLNTSLLGDLQAGLAVFGPLLAASIACSCLPDDASRQVSLAMGSGLGFQDELADEGWESSTAARSDSPCGAEVVGQRLRTHASAAGRSLYAGQGKIASWRWSAAGCLLPSLRRSVASPSRSVVPRAEPEAGGVPVSRTSSLTELTCRCLDQRTVSGRRNASHSETSPPE